MITGIIDNGSREELYVPGVFKGIAGVSGRLTNAGEPQEIGFFSSERHVSADQIPAGTPITLDGEPYRVTSAKMTKVNERAHFIALTVKRDPMPRSSHPAAADLDDDTLDALADLICGDTPDAPIRRSGYELTHFFATAGLNRFVHDGSSRKWWTLAALKQCTPDELIKVILRLASVQLYHGDAGKIRAALSQLNSCMRLAGVRIYLDNTTPRAERILSSIYSPAEQASEPPKKSEELGKIAVEVGNWAKFADDPFMDELDSQSINALSILLIEARCLIDRELGSTNPFSREIHTNWTGIRGASRPPTEAEIQRCCLVIHAACREIDRAPSLDRDASPRNQRQSYVDSGLIDELRSLSGGPFDFRRLLELVRELNIAASGEAHMATAMLVRAILDHVPPALSCKSFPEIASSYSGTKSFKDHMGKLDTSLRKVADGYLHTQIRKRESVPTGVEVDFRAAVGELLREIIRVAHDA